MGDTYERDGVRYAQLHRLAVGACKYYWRGWFIWRDGREWVAGPPHSARLIVADNLRELRRMLAEEEG